MKDLSIQRTDRDSSMELVRILSISMVLFVHYIARVRIVLPTNTFNYFVNEFWSAFTIIGVNCFVLLSGYFGIHSKGLKLRRIINLLLTIAFWSGSDYLLGVVTKTFSFDVKDFIISLVPYIKGGLWFIRVYIVLELIAPFLNISLRRFTQKQYFTLILVLLFLFSFWPSFLPNPIINDGGFGIVHFVVLYIIGGYLKLHYRTNFKWYTYFLIYILCSIVGFSCFLFGWPSTYLCYDFLFNIISSCAIILMFSTHHFKSKVINTVSATTFGLYIIHEGGCFSHELYYKYMMLETVSLSPLFGLLAPLSILVQLIVLSIFVYLQNLLFRVTVDRIIDKIPLFNKVLFDYSESKSEHTT